MTDLEILESLPSLYPLKDFEEKAVLNVCKMFDDIKAEIDSYCSDNRDRNDGLYIAMRIIDKYRESEVENES